ncbi:MAG: heparinase [Deltaproteobacteria bacterium]|nr:heparinase [Deltaproteobacteria bacterium]
MSLIPRLQHYWYLLCSLPPHKLVGAGVERLITGVRNRGQRKEDILNCTYAIDAPLPHLSLVRYLNHIGVSMSESEREEILDVARLFIERRFDLLGSGWVQVKRGMKCDGMEGHVYFSTPPPAADKEGVWLQKLLNPANVVEARRIWRLIGPDYQPIDWSLDFKSGFRWSERTWYRDISYGHSPGADVKVPWELSRMQHLMQMGWAYGLVVSDEGSDAQAAPGLADRFLAEFRNQVLDFIAVNPPRFGVNWHSSMDVAIRAANWLLAHDLFASFGASLDPAFEAVFVRSLCEHGCHIVNNLEHSAEFRANHYLADIVGLLFVAAYLPRTPEIDAWLAFAIQELISETERQFLPDGAHFEASTSYHRLVAEMALYGTGITLGLPEEKRQALLEYDYRRHKVRPPLKPGPMSFFPLPGNGPLSPFPPGWFERLAKMVEFSERITRPDGRAPQIGDNDNGRFFKIRPRRRALTVAQAKDLYLNLKDYNGLADDQTHWDEDHLDHRHLREAWDGLVRRPRQREDSDAESIETRVMRALARDKRVNFPAVALHSPRGPNNTESQATESGLRAGLRLFAYPDFGLYVYKSNRLYLAVRCGGQGHDGRGGHAHNDQLSIELAIDGVPILIDSGTYCYTCSLERRNLFRSTAMHNTLSIPGKEQNPLLPGLSGAFRLPNRARGRVIEAGHDLFIGEHVGFGAPHRRTIQIESTRIKVVDECESNSAKEIRLHLWPNCEVHEIGEPGKIRLVCGKLEVTVSSVNAAWSMENYGFSSGYGLSCQSVAAVLQGEDVRMEWFVARREL